VRNEAKAGAVFFVNTFKVDAKADEVVSVNDKRKCVLYVYRR